MKVAVEHHFIGSTASLGGTYDSNKTLLGSLLKQYSGSNYEDKYISPLKPVMLELMETTGLGSTTAFFGIMDVVSWQNKFLVFICEYEGTVSGIRKQKNILMLELDPQAGTFTYKGRVIIDLKDFPYAYLFGANTGPMYFRGLRGYVYTHTDGTVSTSGSTSTIVGAGTQFVSDRIASGARIGFGTNVASGITSWYELTSINSNTELIINSAVSLTGGTQYVIEEMRLACPFNLVNAFGNATSAYEPSAFSGLLLAKGLNYNIFTTSGTTIDSLTADNQRGFCILRSSIGGDFNKEVTISPTNPAIFTCNNHGLSRSDEVWITTTGNLPTGVTSSAYYKVLQTSGNTFTVAAGLPNTPASATGAQSGIHYLHRGSSTSLSGISDESNNQSTEHIVWALQQDNATGNGSVANRFVKFNLRANLNLRGVSGTVGRSGIWATTPTNLSSDAYIFETQTCLHSGTNAPPSTGIIDVLRVFAPKTGPLAGVTAWWTGVSNNVGGGNARIVRMPIENITYRVETPASMSTVTGSPVWIPTHANLVSDTSIEIPPGGSNTYIFTNTTINQIEYAPSIDRILICPSNNLKRICVVDYDSNRMKPYEKIIGGDLNRIMRSTTATGAPDGLFPSIQSVIREKDGWLFTLPISGTTGLSWVHAFPYAVDSEYHQISNQYVVTPKLATTDATRLYRVYVDNMEYSGSERLGFPVEAYRLWYRTIGIDDNTGEWIPVDVNGSLTEVNPTDYIQFKITFDIMGEFCAPTRIYSIAVVYEDSSQDSHYEPSLNKSSTASKIFAWRQVASWGSNIPNLRIRLFDNANNKLLDDTITSSTYGTWQYSTDGTTWNAWSSSADTVGNYIRYTVSLFGYGAITVRALLTQA